MTRQEAYEHVTALAAAGFDFEPFHVGNVDCTLLAPVALADLCGWLPIITTRRELVQAIQCGERAMARGQYRQRSFWICIGRAWLAIHGPTKEKSNGMP